MGQSRCLLVVVLMLVESTASGTFVAPTNAPVDRLIKNTRAYIREKPNDPEGYYTLARIHYLAFANKTFEVGVTGDPNAAFPRVAPRWLLGDHAHRLLWEHATRLALQEFGYSSPSEVPRDLRQKLRARISQKAAELKEDGWQAPRPAEDQLNRHAALALVNFERAIKFDPDRALYHLGFASLLEQYAAFLKDSYGVPTEFTAIILDRARASYYTAYELSVKKDLKHKHLPAEGLASLVSHEAGQGYIRLSTGKVDTSWADRRRLASVRRSINKFKSLRSRVVTPIVFSLTEYTSLINLLAPDIQVSFDLDGDDVTETWPWVRPTTGILVWDPQRTERITSGRQLFGSVTWWLFFADGYRALDALDDNRDGELTGGELAGISAWFDRNSNGRADKGEIVTLGELGVASVATRRTGRDGDCPMNAKGLTLQEGRTVPTYDWIVSPASAPKRVARP